MVNKPGNESGFWQSGEFPGWVTRYLSRNDASDIEKVISNAEKRTSGEIVTVIVRRSFPLTPPAMQLSLLFSFVYILLAIPHVGDWFSYRDLAVVGLGILACVAAGNYIARTPLAYRIFMPDRDAKTLALSRAELEFYRAGIGTTKGQTGILLFLSVEDHEAVVLADKSISDLLPSETWDEVLGLMLDGVKRSRCAEGLRNAVVRCGDILATHFPIASDDVNELANHLLIIE